ncbi:MAG: MFS transporter [Janthinobacterium lividum]
MAPELPPAVFKSWAPEWLIRATLFLVATPAFMLLVLFSTNSSAIAGHYGVEPADVQFSLLVYYASLLAFFPFDARLSTYLPSRQYLLICSFLLLLTVALGTQLTDFRAQLALRFVQGPLGGLVGSPCLTLIFSRLPTERQRAMGYSVFYGILLVSGPLSTMMSWLVLDRFDVPALSHAFVLLQLPGVLLLAWLLHDVRLKRRFPLSQLEWPSWLLLAGTLLPVGYVVCYGEQLYWFESPRIGGALLLALACGAAFGLRQLHLKRPYLDLRIFRFRNYRIGGLMFVLFYLCRGTTGVAAGYLAGITHGEGSAMAWLQVPTLVGIVLGVSVVVRFVLLDTPVRHIWVVGFALLLVHHVWMYFLFGPGQQPAVFVLPLFVQGLGVGTIMVPTATFALSALPPGISQSGAYAATIFRFAGFTGSMALISVLQPYWNTAQLASYRADLVPGTSLVAARLQSTQQALQSRGLAAETAQLAATRLLGSALSAQAQLRYCQNYFMLISGLIVVVLLGLLVLPPLHRQVASFRQTPL